MRQRVFTGVVTQMQEHHGIVDQEVHFPVSVVVGRVPLVGEKVLVKAVQDPLKPISWTAQKVQTLNGQVLKKEAAETRQASNEQEQDHQNELKRKLERAETLNKTYEKSLRENSSEMIKVIEKMQRMLEQLIKKTLKFKPYRFTMEDIEGFRYRCWNAMRSEMKQAVKEARLTEITQRSSRVK